MRKQCKSLQHIENTQRFVFMMMKGGAAKKSNLSLWSRRGLSSVFWNQQGCKCTQTELGYKCLFMSLGVSVTWPKTTATQKGKTVPATCQPRPKTWCARKPCGVVYEHGCQALGRVACEGRCQGQMLVPDSSAAASTGITEWLRMEGTSGGGTSGGALHPQRKAGTSFWRSPGPTFLLKQSQVLKQTA